MNKLTPQQLVLLNRKLIGESDKIDKEKLLKIDFGEFEEMAESAAYPNDYLKKACTLYAIAKNADKKGKDGIAPALKILSILDDVKEIKDCETKINS